MIHLYDAAIERIEELERCVTDLEQENAQLHELEGIIRGMFPLWIAAMSYAEHGRAADLDRIRNYYNGRDNPLTSDQLHYLFSMENKE
ncbi:MAG: hypothetical protein ABFD50_02280 [Smithella sp.]